MWSSDAVIRSGAFALALVLAPALSACTGFTPVYNTPTVGTEGVAISYGAARSRFDQIIYEDLSLRLGHRAGGPTLSVVTTTRIDSLTSDIVSSAQSQKQLILSAMITLKDVNGAVLFTGQRIASADFTTGLQISANKQAQEDAGERAAHSLADTIRLTVLGTLSK